MRTPGVFLHSNLLSCIPFLGLVRPTIPYFSVSAVEPHVLANLSGIKNMAMFFDLSIVFFAVVVCAVLTATRFNATHAVIGRWHGL